MNKDSKNTDEEIIKIIEEPVIPKETKKKFKVGLVTKSSIIYDDNGVSKFVSREGNEDLKIGDTLKI